MTSRVCTTVFALAVMLAAPSGTGTVRVLSAVGMRQVMLDLGPKFEKASGHRPDIATATAFKSAIPAARRISAPDPALDGSSGVHIANVFARLGIAEQMKPKVVYADPPGPGSSTPASIVADGKADIALHQIQELSGVKGLNVIGPLPGDLQQEFVFSAAIAASASDQTATRALIDFLLTQESRAVITAKGMGAPRRPKPQAPSPTPH